ncbi:MAG: ACP S-malonyltransferase [Candidatus Omnitrophica bacterium]|nr:ACP S-malonyltransferase [Candidatus Omnitrophota bacterium]
MTSIALIFPGQGAQTVGMGKDLYDNSKEAKDIFEKAEQVIGEGFCDIIFNGPQEKLTETAYSQPAILTVSMAALAALKARESFKEMDARFAAGLSLGELSALAASGALSFEETLKLVQQRGAFMQEACRLNEGKMAAVIGLDKYKIIEICASCGAEVANFNSPQQIVITGHADKVEAAVKLLTEAGAKNVVPLDVAGAFHSTLMQSACDKFKAVLDAAPIAGAKTPIISNVDAKPASAPEKIKSNLAAQIVSSVQWVGSVQYMAAQGITNLIECGPGKVLKGLIRRTDKSLKVQNIETYEDVGTITF